ncbi:DivIVA domain-containing protein [Actinomadura barringtoniae]|uniref:DivIVA domain-containing protein n=1 Tax=Actinomadura barringtoniae TaxID=1427535 RepID=A0A939PEM5_9ACTN|nr:DivIVA domain-containing protein [Actinomadura barringtoniae]
MSEERDSRYAVGRLTPARIRGVLFSTTRLRPGYDAQEVDRFLDRAEHELTRLIRERDEALAEAARRREDAARRRAYRLEGRERPAP